MDVRCPKCETEYEFDAARIGPAGVTVRCTECQHVFQVHASPAAAAPAQASEALPPEKGGETPWQVKKVDGDIYTFRDLTTLQKWIVERRVGKDDKISKGGDSWKRLGDIAELGAFFQVVAQAERQAATPPPGATPPVGAPPPVAAPISLGAPSSTAPAGWGTPLPAKEALAKDEPAWARGDVEDDDPEWPPKRRKGGGAFKWLLILLFVGAAAVGAYAFFDPAGAEAWQGRLVALIEAQRAAAPAETPAPSEAPPAPEAPATDAAALDAALDPAGAGEAADGDAGAPETDAPEAGAGEATAETIPAPVELPPAEASPPEEVEAAPAPEPAATPAPKKPLTTAQRLARADRLRDRERTSAALALYGEVLEDEPANVEALVGQGWCYIDLERWVPAKALFKRALKVSPRYGEALMGMAEAARYQGDTETAREYYERYLDALPNGPEARVARKALDEL